MTDAAIKREALYLSDATQDKFVIMLNTSIYLYIFIYIFICFEHKTQSDCSLNHNIAQKNCNFPQILLLLSF